MNVSEQNAMEYDLLCLEYNDSKFDSVENDLTLDTKTFSQAAFDKNGQKVTTITIQLKGFQGRILSEKITIEKDTGSSNTGLPMP